MLRDLTATDAERPCTRKGEKDPDDSVFVVLLWEEHPDRASLQVGSVWLTKGEAEGAANRYVNEGSKVTRFNYVTVVEYQTGQLAPKAERHGGEFRKPAPPEEQTPKSRLEELELEMARIRASMGITQTAGGTAERVIPETSGAVGP